MTRHHIPEELKPIRHVIQALLYGSMRTVAVGCTVLRGFLWFPGQDKRYGFENPLCSDAPLRDTQFTPSPPFSRPVAQITAAILWSLPKHLTHFEYNSVTTGDFGGAYCFRLQGISAKLMLEGVYLTTLTVY